MLEKLNAIMMSQKEMLAGKCYEQKDRISELRQCHVKEKQIPKYRMYLG